MHVHTLTHSHTHVKLVFPAEALNVQSVMTVDFCSRGVPAWLEAAAGCGRDHMKRAAFHMSSLFFTLSISVELVPLLAKK